MIGSLRGTVIDRSASGEALVEAAGVGYRVAVPAGALAGLEPGGSTFLWVHTVVREDTLALYGFPERDQRDMFESLMGASGVGPKLALAILSVHSPEALRRAVQGGDLGALTLVPGVGKRTAQRLLIELTARLGAPAGDGVPGVDGAGSPGAGARADVRSALANLGYGPDEVNEALAALAEDGPVEGLLRDALKLLSAGRAPHRA